MKNETVKTLTQVTILDGLKMLVENNGKPIEGLAMINDNCHSKWKFNQALNHCYEINGSKVFVNDLSETHNRCAKVTEIDPCKAPEGCPEMEPWMAYVGFGPMNEAFTNATDEEALDLYWTKHGKWLNGAAGDDPSRHYAIDVRSEWAQENFPEHCRIRNYQEPKPITDTERLDWIMDNSKGFASKDDGGFVSLKELNRESIDWAIQNQ